MPEFWLLACRRFVPAELRERVFDPAAHDLRHTHATSARRFAVIRASLAIAALALECRRLALLNRRATGTATERGDSVMNLWTLAFRHALRRLRREPLFALVAILTLALGIGANVAIFSVVNTYLWSPLPVPDARQLVRVDGRTREDATDVVSYPNYADARDRAVGVDLAAFGLATVLVGEGETGEARQMELVSGNYFRVLRLAPVAGRLLEAGDDGAEGTRAVVVIGESYWRARLGGDPSAIGRTIRLNGAPFEIVGVVPASFRGTEGANTADLWGPLSMQQVLRPRGLKLTARGWGWLQTIGRLAPAASIATAQTSLDAVAADLNKRFPRKRDPLAFAVTRALSLTPSEQNAFVPVAAIAGGFTVLLLIVACANLAGVMQARLVSRGREVALRQSLGAGRGRLTLEWLAESLVLAFAGGLGGALVARLTTEAFAAFKPPVQLAGNFALSTSFDWRVAGFAAGVSIVAGLLIGLWSAARASSAALARQLLDDAPTTTGGRRGMRMRRSAVIVQVALSAVLLVAAALLAASLRNLRVFDPGFSTERLAMVSVDLRVLRMPDAEINSFRARALDAVRALPGVTSADIVQNVPLMPGRDRLGFRIPGYQLPDGTNTVSLDMNIVGAKYFETMGLVMTRGSTWDPISETPALVINETMARKFWPGRDPVGSSIELVGRGPLTIAGVVRDSTYYHLGETPLPYVYLPAEFAKPPTFAVLARTSSNAADVLAPIRRAVAATDPRATPYDPTTFEDARQVPLYPQRLLAAVATVFGALALLLTGIGLYGVVSTTVSHRTREIGVRMALGARSWDVQAGVLRESLVLVAIGALVGLGGGAAFASALRTWLFGVGSFDAGAYASVTSLLAVLAIVAAWVPARRAAMIDPAITLRQ